MTSNINEPMIFYNIAMLLAIFIILCNSSRNNWPLKSLLHLVTDQWVSSGN